jgi:hypothetical protein
MATSGARDTRPPSQARPYRPPGKLAVQNSWLLLLFLLVVAGAAIYIQIVSNRAYEVEAYNCFEG